MPVEFSCTILSPTYPSFATLSSKTICSSSSKLDGIFVDEFWLSIKKVSDTWLSSSSSNKCPTSFSNSNLISVSVSWEAESKNLPIVPSAKSSNNKSPEPPPVIVPDSNSTWIATLPVSGANPPLTIETSASAVPELNVTVSPISYPEPATFTITSSTPAPEISKTCTRAPSPAPPDNVAPSPTVNVLPSFVIVVVDNPWLTVTLISVSESSKLNPVNTSPFTKVPVVVSALISISVTTTDPSWNFVTFSTIAEAKFILSSAGLFVCVISWPIKSIGSLTDCVVVWVQRIKFCVENLPSDTRNISTVGL